MPVSRAVFEPDIDNRKLDQVSKEAQDALSKAETLELDLDTRKAERQVDSIGQPSFGGGRSGGAGGFGGGMASGGIGSLGGAASKAAMPVALGGAVGFGMLRALESASPALQATTKMFGSAMKLFFRPFGDALANQILPWAQTSMTMAKNFNQLVTEKGLKVALAETAGEKQGGSPLFPILPESIQNIGPDDLFEAIGFDGLARRMREIEDLYDDSKLALAGFNLDMLNFDIPSFPGWPDVRALWPGWPNISLPSGFWPNIPDPAFDIDASITGSIDADIFGSVQDLVENRLDFGSIVDDITARVNANIDIPDVSIPDEIIPDTSGSGTSSPGGGTDPGSRVFPGSTVSESVFQHGGIVTGPTRALIGEAGPEAVIPLDQAQGMIGDEATRILRRILQAIESGDDTSRELSDIRRENRRTRAAVEDLGGILRDLDVGASGLVSR